MTTFLDALKTAGNQTRTLNGAVTNKSTLDPCLDFFSLGGAMRNRIPDAVKLFEKAFYADPLTAIRTLFYLRDIRGGQGERELFRACMRSWSTMTSSGPEDAEAFRRVLALIPEYGRWDDLFFEESPSPAVIGLVKGQIIHDLIVHEMGKPVSLLAKWLPSENTSSQKTRQLAYDLRSKLGYTSADYRRTLSVLRKRIRLLEQDMSANRWDAINFAAIPSQAHRKHVKAFWRHQPERYQDYLNAVTRGEAKINTSTLYPYEVYEMVRKGDQATANVMWENLPDYTRGEDGLVVADVSASMSGRPMAVSVSLALYFAERNQGHLKDHFMTFSQEPQLIQVRGQNLTQRLYSIESSAWSMNTDMLKTFRVILSAALRAGELPPKVLYIISDMEFDAATGETSPYDHSPSEGRSQRTIFQTARSEFNAAGLEMPHVVFWNVNATTTQAPATILDGRVSLVSGCSPTIFSLVVEGKSPRELMDDVVNSERYQAITL